MTCPIEQSWNVHDAQQEKAEAQQAEIDHAVGQLLDGVSVEGWSMQQVIEELAGTEDGDEFIAKCVRRALCDSEHLEKQAMPALEAVAKKALGIEG